MPNDVVREVHERMPVILDPADYPQWLDPTVQKPDALKPLLRPFPAHRMEGYAVARRMNNPSYDGPNCIEPIERLF